MAEDYRKPWKHSSNKLLTKWQQPKQNCLSDFLGTGNLPMKNWRHNLVPHKPLSFLQFASKKTILGWPWGTPFWLINQGYTNEIKPAKCLSSKKLGFIHPNNLQKQNAAWNHETRPLYAFMIANCSQLQPFAAPNCWAARWSYSTEMLMIVNNCHSVSQCQMVVVCCNHNSYELDLISSCHTDN